MEQINKRTRRLTLMGILLALAIVLSMLEHSIPTIPGMPPNTKLGLSNIIVMYTMFFLGVRYAYVMALLKSIFIMMMRGVIAGFISLSGGLVSVTIMAVLLLIFNENITYVLISVAGSLGHNLGQLLAASVYLKYNVLKVYWPFSLISGVVFGIITGIVLGIIIPPISKISDLVVNNNTKE